jgi:hypothetical protein
VERFTTIDLLARSNHWCKRQFYRVVAWYALPKWKLFVFCARHKFPDWQMWTGFGSMTARRPDDTLNKFLQNRIGIVIPRKPKLLKG